MTEAYAVRTLSPMRKVIAARMAEATRTIPHFRLSAQIEIDALLAVRRRLNERSQQADLSLTDLLIKICATALMDAPAVNVQWVDGQVHEYHSADVSVVTALPDGLSTPIVRCADSKSVWEIAREIKELAARAASNALRMDEVFGGSFSVSNLGMHGVDQFDAIINAPQCAILALGRGKPCCLASAEGNVRVATVMTATLSIDHRVLDGVAAAAFLAALRRRIEEPDGVLTHD